MTTKKHVTISDVADRAGVSKMTVSRVINQKGEISEATRQRVMAAMQELAYRPNQIAKRLATNATFQIGIVVPSLANQYFGEIIEGAEHVFWDHDYHILLCHTNADPVREQAVMHVFEDNRVDGVIVLSAHGSPDTLSLALQNQRAAVVINTAVTPGVAKRIFTDEIRSMALAVNHLIANGRRHIGYIAFDIQTYASHERRRGFEMAVHQAGLEYDPRKQSVEVSTEFSHETNLIIERMLTNDPQIDALVCFNTGIAAKALQSCHALGRRVPDEIALIGYDNNIIAELMTPTLTTVDFEISKKEVGAMAAKLLLERLENDDAPPEDVILHHTLIVRESAP